MSASFSICVVLVLPQRFNFFGNVLIVQEQGSLENKWADQHVFVESDDASISFVMKYIIRPTDLVDIVEDVGNRMVEVSLIGYL